MTPAPGWNGLSKAYYFPAVERKKSVMFVRRGGSVLFPFPSFLLLKFEFHRSRARKAGSIDTWDTDRIHSFPNFNVSHRKKSVVGHFERYPDSCSAFVPCIRYIRWFVPGSDPRDTPNTRSRTRNRKRGNSKSRKGGVHASSRNSNCPITN